MFVLVRTDGKFVAPPGQEKSYTSDLAKARTYSTKQAADADRCVQNEYIMPVEQLLNRSRNS